MSIQPLAAIHNKPYIFTDVVIFCCRFYLLPFFPLPFLPLPILPLPFSFRESITLHFFHGIPAK